MYNINLFAEVMTLAAVLFVLNSWIESRRARRIIEQEKVRQSHLFQILLKTYYGSKSYLLKVSLHRSDLSRAEVLGLLRIIPWRRSSLFIPKRYVSSLSFVRQVDAISNADGSAMSEFLSCPKKLEQIGFEGISDDQMQCVQYKTKQESAQDLLLNLSHPFHTEQQTWLIELTTRWMAYLPTVIRLRLAAKVTSPQFEAAEIISQQTIQYRGRNKRGHHP